MNDGFRKWWQETGRYIDPDTEDVPWFDKREALAELAWNAASSDEQETRETLERVNTVDLERDNRLRGKTPWHPYSEDICRRTGFLAWREAEGGKEILAYNNALCDPITISFRPQGT